MPDPNWNQFHNEIETAARKNLTSPMQQTIDEQTVTINDQATRITELEEQSKPPAPELTCQFGVLGTGTTVAFADLHPHVEVVRCYTGNTTDWINEPQHKKIQNKNVLFAPSNTIDLSLDGLDKLLASIPEADKERIVGWCDAHEPENPAKKLDPAQYRTRRAKSNEIIRDHGLPAVSCLMGWTCDPNSGRNWHDWVHIPTTDVLCWDTYNAGAKKNPPVYQDVEKMLSDCLKASTETDLPWGLWETGTTNFGAVDARVKWIKQLRQACMDHDAVQAIYFDRKGVSNPDWDASLDHATASAWLGV